MIMSRCLGPQHHASLDGLAPFRVRVIAEHSAVAEVAVIGVPASPRTQISPGSALPQGFAGALRRQGARRLQKAAVARHSRPDSKDCGRQISRRLLRETYWQGQERRVG
jgi:hypothetical protein